MKNLIVLTSVIIGSGLLSAKSPTSSFEASRHMKRNADAAGPVGRVSIIVDKSDYELSVYDEKGWYATYPVVFGSNSLADKKMEGDKLTPEGTFFINGKRNHEKWHRFMGIDYPNEESREKFNKRKQTGEIPASARIGGSIGIHGTWPHEDFVIDKYKNWTLGCISMKNGDVQELYKYTGVGTKVIIRK